METAVSTTTRDILGLALLAVLSARPSGRSEAVDAVRGVCLPWLTPTREVVDGLISEYCAAGLLHAACESGRDAHPLNGVLLEMTRDGERELRHLVLHRTGQPVHPLAILCESLRLSAAARLDPPERGEVLRGQIRARRRCLATQQRRLAKAGSENPMLAPTLRHQIAYAQAEFDALAHASRADSEESTILVHSHRHQIARAQTDHASGTIANESKNHLHLESDQTTFPARGIPMPVRNGKGWRNPPGHARAQSAPNQHDETRKE